MKKLALLLLALVAQNLSAADPAPFKVEVTGSGPPMILIPGLACGPNVWDGTVAHFKGRYQCHVLTLAGFAGQPPIEGPFLEKIRDGIVKYIHDKKLKRPVIIGHSLGGFMSFWVAEAAPKDVGPIVAVDGLPFFSAVINPEATVESSKAFGVQLRDMFAGLSRPAFAQNNLQFLSSTITDPANVAKVASQGTNSDPKAVGQAFYDLVTTDLRPDEKSIQSPVLLISAESGAGPDMDQKTKEQAYAAQIKDIPHHKLVFAPKSKHFVQLDNPSFFYKEVDAFLKQNSK